MCGISGFLYFDGAPASNATIRAMSDEQQHRGPDQSGIFTRPGIALGHRRLSIIDLSSGKQPLCNEDGTVWISFNGEIYNYLELRKELEGSHRFVTRSDTETIVHLYESHPDTFVSRLRGMFAFALWDQNRRTLILARDRVGKKPLYYYLDNDKLVFASEIKSILQHPNLEIPIDEYAVSDYLSLGYIPAPRSIYRSIRKLRPGHWLRVKDGKVEEMRYWDLSFRQHENHTEEEWRELLQHQLQTAVKIRLMSEVPLGGFLSGGVDSSGVVAMMGDFLDDPVKTATIGFAEEKFDESRYARQVSEYLKTDHHERVVTPQNTDVIEKLSWHYDEPFADSSALPTYFVSQVAREKVTVALSGDGGDENFAGYNRYSMDLQENRIRKYVPWPIRKAIFGPLGSVYPKMDWAPRCVRAKSTFQSLGCGPVEGYFESMSTFRRYEKPSIMSHDLRSRLGGYDTVDVFRGHYDRADSDDPLSRIQYVDVNTYLTDDILTKVDRASMANSLEVRCPLLDHKVMELCASMPSTLKLKGAVAKYIFKKTLEKKLPAEIIYRNKMGFAVPLASWFRNGMRDYARAHILERHDPFISSSFVKKIWNQHQSGVRDRSTQLWNILMFRLWFERSQG